jgi:hypothetical protein
VHLGSQEQPKDENPEEAAAAAGGANAGGGTAANSPADTELVGRVDKIEASLVAIAKSLEDLSAKVGGQAPPEEAAATGDDDEPDEATMMDEAPEVEPEKAVKANDSASWRERFHATIADAEILSPGIKVPTFDSKLRPAQTVKAICDLRLQAVTRALTVTDTAALLKQANGGRTLNLKAATCDSIRVVFNAAAALKKAANGAGQLGAMSGGAAAPQLRAKFDFNGAMDKVHGR